ncbi:hypothetical protein ACFSKI_16320 [Pseudogracilibacillus auburnensis]|uniref:Uncharacterized protein n=1 Tax=Pseudogracilibacillus auburnensis TaxID=1494959 RepID=A0A2V3W585_9BACI|nr:hypothetical protein [Pseudogracilibacillus auburnensis]PXW89467.1 hypothetical protein DFR56_102244 [Pseudogracilibacillus auburnensis]
MYEWISLLHFGRSFVIGLQLFLESNNAIRDMSIKYPNGFIDSNEKLVLFDRTDSTVVYDYRYVDEKEMQLDQIIV